MNWLLQPTVLLHLEAKRKKTAEKKTICHKKLHETKTHKAPRCNILKLREDRKTWKLIYVFFSSFLRWTFYCIFVFTTDRNLRWTIKLESSIHLIKFISILLRFRLADQSQRLSTSNVTKAQGNACWCLKLKAPNDT